MTKTQKQKFTKALNELILSHKDIPFNLGWIKTKRLRLYRVVEELIKEGK